MRNLILLLLIAASAACFAAAPATRADSIARDLLDPASRRVIVVSHRGDWRNYPENSLPAVENAIRMGVDMVEIDIALTADSVLVVCHDRTIDRTTDGRGRISQLTLDSIRRCRLRTGHGVGTVHRVPTLREMLELCRGRVCVNIDKGYEYYDLVLAETEATGTTSTVLIKGTYDPERVEEKMAAHPHNMMYMPVMNLATERGRRLIGLYAGCEAPIACEIVWREMDETVAAAMREVLERGSRLWTNSLWPSLCGGLADDAAYEGDPDRIYGEHIRLGATIIQTDRPELLLGWLRSRGLHD